MNSPMTKEELIRMLTAAGFTYEEIEVNLQNYLEAITALTIEDYLLQIPKLEGEAILSDIDLNDPKGQNLLKERFEKHFQVNHQNYHPSFNINDLKDKIENYMTSKIV